MATRYTTFPSLSISWSHGAALPDQRVDDCRRVSAIRIDRIREPQGRRPRQPSMDSDTISGDPRAVVGRTMQLDLPGVADRG